METDAKIFKKLKLLSVSNWVSVWEQEEQFRVSVGNIRTADRES